MFKTTLHRAFKSRRPTTGHFQSADSSAQEHAYGAMFRLNPCPMLIFDEDTLRFLDVNKAAVKLYGWSRQDFLRMTVKDVYPAEELRRLRKKPVRQGRAGAAFAVKWRHWRTDHTLLDVEVTSSGIQCQGRKACLLMVSDITERRRDEESLRESEERFRQMANNVEEVFWLTNATLSELLYVSPAFERIWGRSCQELYQNPRLWVEAVHPDDRKRVGKTFFSHRACDGGMRAEYRIVRPDGSIRWISDYGAVVKNKDGRVYRYAGVAMDITKRKRAEEELKKLAATLEGRVAARTEELSDALDRLRAIQDGALVGILTLDERGLIQTFNPAAAALFGYSPKEMQNRNVGRLMASPHQLEGGGFLPQPTRPGDQRFMVIGREVLGLRKNGEVKMLELTLSDFTHGGRREFVAMVRDITRRKRLQRELLEAGERERQRLGHDLHDGLGQHLHALYFMASLLVKEAKETSPKLVPEACRLARQLEQALELSRGLARGLQPVNAVPEGLMIALRELAGRTRELYRIACRFECRAPILIHRHFAANHLYRIAQEAVNNAMKHGNPTLVRIKLTASLQRIVLGIHDNGVGIREPAGHARGMGMHIMQYRADALSGSLLVQRHPRGGTEVVCTVTRQALLPQEESSK